MRSHLQIPISDASSIGEARRTVVRVASQAQLNETDSGRASVIATELATNLVRHANPAQGFILAAADGVGAIEILSVDLGPGMSNVARCFEDGFSTGGTPGNGMGAIRRMSDEMDVFSDAGGTILWCRVVSRVSGSQRSAREIGLPRISALSVPVAGETECGDVWRTARSEAGLISVMIADGLGHGPYAAEAAEGACMVFDADPFVAPEAILDQMHSRISGTRGAAVAIAQIDAEASQLRYAGVGNISGTLLAYDGSRRGLVSHNGIVGHQVRKLQRFEYPWTHNNLLVLHSDGLQTRWTLDQHAGAINCHPGIVAGMLYRDYRRGKDDASIVVVSPPAGGN